MSIRNHINLAKWRQSWILHEFLAGQPKISINVIVAAQIMNEHCRSSTSICCSCAARVLITQTCLGKPRFALKAFPIYRTEKSLYWPLTLLNCLERWLRPQQDRNTFMHDPHAAHEHLAVHAANSVVEWTFFARPFATGNSNLHKYTRRWSYEMQSFPDGRKIELPKRFLFTYRSVICIELSEFINVVLLVLWMQSCVSSSMQWNCSSWPYAHTHVQSITRMPGN